MTTVFHLKHSNYIYGLKERLGKQNNSKRVLCKASIIRRSSESYKKVQNTKSPFLRLVIHMEHCNPINGLNQNSYANKTVYTCTLRSIDRLLDSWKVQKIPICEQNEGHTIQSWIQIHYYWPRNCHFWYIELHFAQTFIPLTAFTAPAAGWCLSKHIFLALLCLRNHLLNVSNRELASKATILYFGHSLSQVCARFTYLRSLTTCVCLWSVFFILFLRNHFFDDFVIFYVRSAQTLGVFQIS